MIRWKITDKGTRIGHNLVVLKISSKPHLIADIGRWAPVGKCRGCQCGTLHSLACGHQHWRSSSNLLCFCTKWFPKNIQNWDRNRHKVSLGREKKQEYNIEPAPSKVRTTTDRRHNRRCHGRKHLWRANMQLWGRYCFLGYLHPYFQQHFLQISRTMPAS